MNEPTLYRLEQRFPNLSEELLWQDRRSGKGGVLVPVEPEAYVYRQGGLSEAFYRCEKGEADAVLFRIGGEHE